jgi:hypothetical protein
VSPRLDDDHDGQRDYHQCEQEVSHHSQRVELEHDRDPAEGNLRNGAGERRERGQPDAL